MKIAPREISALLHQPESRFHAYLLYGHDEGLVRERARKLASHFADNLDDPFAVSHLTGPDVAADKASLSDSLNALPAFGGLRLVMLSGAGTEMTEAVKLAFEHLHEGARLVIQARDVNTRHALVKFCDQQPSCASIGCYQDDSRSLGELARAIFAKDSIKIETNALALLLSRLGNDRAVSRMEIEKLVLFAGPGGTLNAQDIDHALGDSGAIVQDQITIAILSGNVKQFEQLFKLFHIAAQNGDGDLILNNCATVTKSVVNILCIQRASWACKQDQLFNLHARDSTVIAKSGQ